MRQYLNIVNKEINKYLTNLGVFYDSTKLCYVGLLENTSFTKAQLVTLLLYTAPLSTKALDALHDFKYMSVDFLPVGKLPNRQELDIPEDVYKEAQRLYDETFYDKVVEFYVETGHGHMITKYGDMTTDLEARKKVFDEFLDSSLEHFSGWMFVSDKEEYTEEELMKRVEVAGDPITNIVVTFEKDERTMYLHAGLGARSGAKYQTAPPN